MSYRNAVASQGGASITWPIVRKKSLISLRSAAFVTKYACNLVYPTYI